MSGRVDGLFSEESEGLRSSLAGRKLLKDLGTSLDVRHEGY